MTLRGSKAYELGVYEFNRLVNFLWPILVASVGTYLTGRIVDLQQGGSLVMAGVLAGVLKLAKLYFGDNTRARV